MSQTQSNPVTTHEAPYPHTEADDIAVQNVDALAQEQFDRFAPNTDPTAGMSEWHRKALQLGTQVAHMAEVSFGGRSAHTAEARTTRDDERVKVGLPPKYSR